MILGISMAMAITSGALAITNGQVDDFQGGTVMGWSEGFLSPNPPIVNIDGGPTGSGDHSLRNLSSGGLGSGSKMAMFNTSQWTGDYLAAGVQQIDLMMKASSSGSSLMMRIAISTPGVPATWYASTNAFALPNDDQWYLVSFGLTAADLTLVQGTGTLNDVLANVTELRLVSAAGGPNFRGDALVATLNVDNLKAGPTCADIIAAGQGLASDISGPSGLADCRVDFFDFAQLANGWQSTYTLIDLQNMTGDWLSCNDPAGCS